MVTPHTAMDAAWLWVDLPLTPYRQAWALQKRIVACKISGRFTPNVFLALEHPAVFTLGRRGGLENLKIPSGELERRGVETVAVERGGNITYHGPGQMVVYPIVDLKNQRIAVTELVDRLEEAMIRCSGDAGVETRRSAQNRGVWVGNHKIGSVGIAVRRGISLHGLALNVDPDLSPFDWINPCGLKGVGMTSLKKEGAARCDMPWIRRSMRRHFEGIFNIRFRIENQSTLATLLCDEKRKIP